MLGIDYREDAEEKQMISEQSSNDEEKAFDSKSNPLLDWSWQRIGVPKKVASWLAHMDEDGTSLVKTPFAVAYCRICVYRSLADTYTLEVPSESAILFSFSAKRGRGQEDLPSTIKFVAVDDIIATSIRILDE